MTSPINLDVPDLAALVAAKQAEVEQAADTPVTIADVAAAAFVALESVVALLPDHLKQNVIDQFEQRAAVFAASMAEADAANPDD